MLMTTEPTDLRLGLTLTRNMIISISYFLSDFDKGNGRIGLSCLQV